MKYSSEFSCTSQKREKKISDREQKKTVCDWMREKREFQFFVVASPADANVRPFRDVANCQPIQAEK